MYYYIWNSLKADPYHLMSCICCQQLCGGMMTMALLCVLGTRSISPYLYKLRITKACHVWSSRLTTISCLSFLPPANVVSQGSVFTGVCPSTRGGECIPACLADLMTNQQYIISCTVAGPSWCGGSIQVTSNAWWDRTHGTPLADITLGRHTPGRHPSPRADTPPPPYTVNNRSVRIHLECILVYLMSLCPQLLWSNTTYINTFFFFKITEACHRWPLRKRTRAKETKFLNISRKKRKCTYCGVCLGEVSAHGGVHLQMKDKAFQPKLSASCIGLVPLCYFCWY